MNIIHIVHGKANPNGHNGISRVVYFLNKHEKLLGHNSEIWAVVDGQKKHETYRRDEYVNIEMFPRVNFLNKDNANGICRYIKDNKERIDIIHFHMIWFLDKNIITKVILECKIPFLITTHGTYNCPHAYTGKRLIAKYLYETNYLNSATEIHALQQDEAYGNYKYGVRVPQFILPNGIEPQEIPAIRSSKFRESFENKIVLLWIGVFRSDKNLEQLLEALSMLPNHIKGSLIQILAGPDNKGNKEKLCYRAKELGLEDIVIFKDAVYNQDKYDLIESADVYIMPSLSEGMSMAILDAMACGKPCILTKQCGMEYYLNENFFFMCEPFAQDIKRAVMEMFEKRAELTLMGENAARLIHNVFSWEQVASNMIENYKRILEK